MVVPERIGCEFRSRLQIRVTLKKDTPAAPVLFQISRYDEWRLSSGLDNLETGYSR